MTSITTIFAVCLVLVILLILRAVLVLKKIRQGGPSKSQRSSPIRTVVVLGSGGHTTEMLQLLQSLDPKHYNPLTFIVAQTDTTSMKRVQARNDDDGQVVQPDAIHFIPRSREVGQSYLTSILTTVWSLIYTLGIMVQVRPGLLLCNGPGTCLPIAVWTFVGRVLGLWEGKIVFCESFCRVTSLSLTGRLLYHIADLFVVHWEQLQGIYPRSQLVTTFVPHSASGDKKG